MSLTTKQKEIRDIAEADLRAFVGLVAPERHLGHCHHDLLNFFMKEDELYQLVLWPRGHQKSTMAAYWAAWKIVTDPSITILYVSATADLAEKQINFIKSILTGPTVKKYWPDLIHIDPNKRELWRSMEFSVDSPKRKAEAIRYPTCKAVGLGGNVTGFHAEAVVLDDVVIYDNAETKTERDKVKSYYSLYNSILNAGGHVKVVGTRYHQDDLYNDMMEMTEDIYDEDGAVTHSEDIFSVLTAVVETDGEFLWPRSKRKDGKWFGFNRKVLNRIKANYLNKAQYWAQYYNDPSDPYNKRITDFKYYDRDHLRSFEYTWTINGNRLNVFAAIDFAATATKRSDYTAIVVVGVDKDHNIFVLDIDRFKTDKISVMQQNLNKLYDKWRWIKLRAEVNAAQNLVANQIQELNRQQGIFYTIDRVNSITNKEIRIMANLEPRYAAGRIYHYRGGNCQILEDELESTKPQHDDVSDALAAAVEISIAPSHKRSKRKSNVIQYHPRFGGIQAVA